MSTQDIRLIRKALTIRHHSLRQRTAIGIQIPDIPGAVTAGDTFEEAYNAAIEVAHLMLEEIVTNGGTAPLPTSTANHRDNPDYAGMGWGMLEIAPLLGQDRKGQRHPARLRLQRIDNFVRDHNITGALRSTLGIRNE